MSSLFIVLHSNLHYYFGPMLSICLSCVGVVLFQVWSYTLHHNLTSTLPAMYLHIVATQTTVTDPLEAPFVVHVTLYCVWPSVLVCLAGWFGFTVKTSNLQIQRPTVVHCQLLFSNRNLLYWWEGAVVLMWCSTHTDDLLLLVLHVRHDLDWNTLLSLVKPPHLWHYLTRRHHGRSLTPPSVYRPSKPWMGAPGAAVGRSQSQSC